MKLKSWFLCFKTSRQTIAIGVLYFFSSFLFYNIYNLEFIDLYCWFFLNSYLERFFELSASKFREKILLDLHYFAIKFAVQECSFNKIQISSFVSSLFHLNLGHITFGQVFKFCTGPFFHYHLFFCFSSVSIWRSLG